MSDQEYSGQLYPSEDQDCDSIPIISDHHWSLWHHQNGPTSPSFCMEEVDHEAAHYSNILNDLSRFEVPSSLPLQELNPGTDIPCSKDIILNSLEKGQSSGTKRKHASDFLEMQEKERYLLEDGVKEDPASTSDQSKEQKGTRCTQVHNQNEKLRRQKLKEKMKALQELIPNCNKRDKTSTLDAAIKYIKTLQYQVQMMSIGAGYSTFHSPLMMMPQGPQPGLQGFQIPNLAPFSGMFSSFNFPMSQLGLPNPCLLPSSSATSGLPAPGGISAAAAHSIQNPGNFLEPLNLTSSSSMDWTSLYETSFHSSGSQSTSPSSRGLINEQSCTRRESTARVLPSKIVLPHLNKEVKDYGPSRSGSIEWSSSSTAK